MSDLFCKTADTLDCSPRSTHVVLTALAKSIVLAVNDVVL